MVRFNPFDFGMDQLRLDTKLFNLKTKRGYKVYGLKQAGSPVIKLSVRPPLELPKTLGRFLNRSGLITILEKITAAPATSPYHVRIGLRRDLRDHPELAAAILQTIVYNMERKLKLPRGFVIEGMPVFPNAGHHRKTPSFLPPKGHDHVEYFGWCQRGSGDSTWRWMPTVMDNVNGPLDAGRWEYLPPIVPAPIW